MALTDIFKNIGNGFGEEVREFKSIMRRIRLTADSSAIGANFRQYGASFGTYDFDAFVKRAREFFDQAMKSRTDGFIIVSVPNNRIAIDFNGEMRGIFSLKGKPLAFFRPDYRASGYASKSDELNDFRRGRNVLFS